MSAHNTDGIEARDNDVFVRKDALSQKQLLDVDEGQMGGIPEEER